MVRPWNLPRLLRPRWSRGTEIILTAPGAVPIAADRLVAGFYIDYSVHPGMPTNATTPTDSASSRVSASILLDLCKPDDTQARMSVMHGANGVRGVAIREAEEDRLGGERMRYKPAPAWPPLPPSAGRISRRGEREVILAQASDRFNQPPAVYTATAT